MKNKKLLAILAILGLVVFYVVLTQNSGQSTPEKEESQKKSLGVLQFVTHESLDEIYQGIKEGLKEGGYVDGDNLSISFMNAEADQNQIQKMSEQLVGQDHDALIGIATPAAQGLASASSDIPIIMGAVTDPIGANLVKNLKAPEKNITGVSDANPVEDAVKLIQTMTPDVKVIGVLYSSSEDNSVSQLETFTKAAEAAGFEIEAFAVPSSNELAATVTSMLPKVDAIWTPIDNTIASAFPTVINAAKSAKKPIYTSVEAMVEQGGLASVSLDQKALGVATGKMAAAILKGQEPAKTPVEIYNKGSIVINQKVADELGLSLSEDLLEKAEKIID